MPAGAKISMASMKAEPMMPNMSVTPFETMVSTKASDGVILVGPVGTLRLFVSVCLFMTRLSPEMVGVLFIGTPRSDIRLKNQL
jgi:hypothetical protein